MADRLETLLDRFPVSARLSCSGTLEATRGIDEADGAQLHLLRRGRLSCVHGAASTALIGEPGVLLIARPMAHRLVADPAHPADLASARLQFDGGSANPIAAALPPFLHLPLASIHGSREVLALLFDEAFHERCGRHALVDRLFDVVLIQILRELMESGHIRGGLLAGLAHPRLRDALVAMHEAPARDWSLDALAASAGMSRSAFAGAFRDTLGCTPGTYLQGWRVGLAQQALRRGRALKVIAGEVGYGSEAALSRAFKAQTGASPRQWRARTLSGGARSAESA
ncbi:MAG: AraC family transcriptional regulator [Xanthomonadales bacterium]|nr:AraC family transcriptional regulator [Xanthomonadales bacterium]